ncbi:MAG: site-2 protease family protein [Anaerolineae bacterium]|nr:site-2 protease family protein [Anaerolineae bacterium]
MGFLEEIFQRPAVLISRLVALLVAVTIHEFAHAYTAMRMGDYTAYENGQVSLNPLKHINPMGFLIFLVTGLPIGPLGQAPVDHHRMRNPRVGMTLTSAAGPISNLITAVVFAIPWWFGWLSMDAYIESYYLGSTIIPSLSEIGYTVILWNVLLGFFNLIPLAPLDGWTVVLGLLPPEQANIWARYQRESMYLFLILLFLSLLPIPGIPNIFGLLISQPTYNTVNFLVTLGR